LKKGSYLVGIGAIGGTKETLGAEGIVHQTCDCRRVRGISGAKLRRSRQLVDFTAGAADGGMASAALSHSRCSELRSAWTGESPVPTLSNSVH